MRYFDSLIAARRVGPSGRVIGIDFSEPAIQRARSVVAALELGNLRLEYPLADLPSSISGGGYLLFASTAWQITSGGSAGNPLRMRPISPSAST